MLASTMEPPVRFEHQPQPAAASAVRRLEHLHVFPKVSITPAASITWSLQLGSGCDQQLRRDIAAESSCILALPGVSVLSREQQSAADWHPSAVYCAAVCSVQATGRSVHHRHATPPAVRSRHGGREVMLWWATSTLTTKTGITAVLAAIARDAAPPYQGPALLPAVSPTHLVSQQVCHEDIWYSIPYDTCS
jgi:hypothetical protein